MYWFLYDNGLRHEIVKSTIYQKGSLGKFLVKFAKFLRIHFSTQQLRQLLLMFFTVLLVS